MPTYLSPGVYVEEISSGSAPIASLGTSTAGFIGVIPTRTINIPISPLMLVTDTKIGDNNTTEFYLEQFPVNQNVKAQVIVTDPGSGISTSMEISPVLLTGTGNDAEKKAKVTINTPPGDQYTVKITYALEAVRVTKELIFDIGELATLDDEIEKALEKYPVDTNEATWTVYVDDVDNIIQDEEVQFSGDPLNKVSAITINTGSLKGNPTYYNIDTSQTAKAFQISLDYQAKLFPTFNLPEPKEVKLCTNFSEFKKYFGDFSLDENQKRLAHAVYGFFNNGGSRCYVSRVEGESEISSVLEEKFEAIDEIAIVAAPGVIDQDVLGQIVTHCQKMGDRFAILDCGEDKTASDVNVGMPSNSNYAAYYFPWIKVSDPVTKIMNPNAKGEETYLSVPPSGHIAGVYARVDAQRGVHKAPANEVIFGALGIKEKISKSQQDGLNPLGINCIRDLNGNIRIWGARTVGGDANGEFKYINVRRLFLSIRDSIEAGTQWTVFEPNDMELWAKIRRNVNAYLTNVWRSGALFGATPQEAFFVKCDAENNPPEVRDLGQVVIEIGVAPVKPAEFVIFRISQWSGSGG